MANLPEIPAFDEGIYQIEQADPVLGGAPNPATGAGLVNIPHQQLARRTRFLKEALDAIEAELQQFPLAALAPRQSPAFSGNPTAPTPPQDTNSTRLATTAFVLGQAGSAAPLAAGTAAPGTSPRFARQDHRHPTDTTRAPVASPALTGTPTAPTPAADTNNQQIATTAFVLGQAGSAAPLAAGAAAPGTSPRYARQDHRHPTDTTRAPVASPALTGTPTAPTPPQGNSSTRIATTQFVRDEFDASLAGSGWQRLASGLIIQWGSGAYNGDTGATGTVINLPIAFPNAFFQAVASDVAQGVNSVAAAPSGLGALRVWARTPGGTFFNTQISWIAFGR